MEILAIVFVIVVMVSIVNLYYLHKKTNEHLQRIEELLIKLVEKKE